ncbi:2-deoxy-D-gluconate 3-dehydrogenase [Hypericibacter adhaerens]|uniref:2-deoxy-D-gluconate 3-dehydrogenase n=2 Tax=Hypericibacter adhaerens TaxID=2602016 RepID=A0A5J6N502_9PROT|nr:2-deoxy-D-gluconate 3-dehydrogenase [Hypericibacter adhaerens]
MTMPSPRNGLFDLTGKVAIVTGGNGGIGLGMAKGLADAGATVVIAARDAAKGEGAVMALAASGARSGFVAVDVTDAASCRGLVERTVERFGRLDILINNAGINIRKAPESYTPEEWHRVLDINLTGAFLCSQAAHPALCRAGGGKIVNIGSMMSIFGAAFAVPYAASKGGIVQMTKALATAWAKDKIQVNAVLPGWIDTDLTRQTRRQMPGFHERIEARTPAGRWGSPDDMAGVAVFLSAPASDFVTGAAITVDGGYAAQG